MATSAGKILIMPKGAWDASTTYGYLDLVTYNGSKWLCKVASCTNVEPTASATIYWYAWDDSNVGGSTVEFAESAVRTNLASGDTVATLFGKTKKFFTDIKNVAYTGDFADLSNVPDASTTTKGVVKVDGSTITVDSNGVIHGAGGDAKDIDYDNQTSKLLATKVQGAIDEVVTKNDGKGDTLTFDEDNSWICLRSGGTSGTILSHVTIEGGASSIIHVDTTEESWKGSSTVTVTISDSEETFTGNFDATGDYYHKVHYLGIYTITVTDGEDSYTTTCNVTTIGAVYVVNIAPVSYQGWLDAGGVTKSFASLDEVLADESTVAILMTKHASVDYLVEWFEKDDTLASTILASDNALKWIGLKDYAYDNMPSSFITSWLASEKWEYALKDKVPTMTSDTTPSGACFGAEYNASGGSPFNAFDGSTTTRFIGYSTSAGTSTIGYKFVNPISLNRFKIRANYESNYVYPTNVELQGSNDGTNYTSIQSFTCSNLTSGQEEEYKLTTNSDYYLYYRVLMTRRALSTVYYATITEIQFYGRSLTVSVPTMTSNNQPSGEVSASSIYSSDYDGWKAFNGSSASDTDRWATSSASQGYIQYKFDNPTSVRMVALKNAVSGVAYTIQIKGSNNNTDWDNIGSSFSISDTSLNISSIVNNNAYSYYRVDISTSSTAISFYTVQFYGVDYSENITLTIHSAKEDTIYYYDSGVETTLVKFSSGATSGSATIPIDTLANGLTLYSSVAKDTTSGTSDYSKNVSLSDSITDIKLMPSKALLWYGYVSDLGGSLVVDSTMGSGWTRSGSYDFSPTNYKTITCGTSGNQCYDFAFANQITLSNEKVAIRTNWGDTRSGVLSNSGYIIVANLCTGTNQFYNNNYFASSRTNYLTNTISTFHKGTITSRTTNVYALWLE